MKPIILASASLRRQQLFNVLGYDYKVIIPQVDEQFYDHETPHDTAKRLAYEKAIDVFNKHSDATIVGCDTIVAVDGVMLGKPLDKDDAERMLRLLKNKRHVVVTGCCVKNENTMHVFSSEARVTFDDMTACEIDAYIRSEEPFGKAGGYAIQGEAAKFIKKIEGDYYAVMGLPVHLLYRTLQTLS